MATEVNVKLTGDTKQFDNSVSKSTQKLEGLGDAAKALTAASAAAFAGLSAVVGTTTKKFADFDNELRGVKTLLNDSSFGAKGLEKGFEELRSDVLKLGAESAVSLSDLNKALFDTISAGVDAAEAIDVLSAASKLAVAGLTDVATATDGVTSALGAYGLAAEEADSVAAKFFAAQVEGKTTIEQLSSSIGLTAATAASAGISLDELLASVSAVTTAGIRTNSAFTGLKAAIANIAKPTAEAQKEAKRLNVEFSASALRAKGLEKFLGDLTDANGFTRDSITRLFGSVEAQNIIFSLAGNQAEKFSDTVKKLGNEQNNASQFTDAFETQNASLTNQFKILSSSIDAFLVKLGAEFAPTVAKGIKLATEFIDVLTENEALLATIGNIVKFGFAVTGLTTALGLAALGIKGLAFAMVPLNTALGITTGLVSTLVGVTGIGALTVAIGALSFAFAKAETADREFNNALNESGETVEDQRKKMDELGEALKRVSAVQAGLSADPLVLFDESSVPTFQKILDQFDEFAGQTERVPQLTQEMIDKIEEQKKTQEEKEKERKQRKLEEDQAAFEQELELEKERRQLKANQNEEFLKGSLEREKALVEKAQAKGLNTDKSLIKTKRQLEEDDRKRRIGEFNKENALFVRDRINSNAQIAKANAIFRNKETRAAKQGLDNLATLTQSSNKTLFTIGKLAAISSAIINTAQGATKALAQGGVLGPALAATVVAAGAVQLATIKSQKFQGAREGGLLKGGIPGQDTIPFFATDQELIAPAKNFEEVIGSVRAKREADRVFDSPTFEQAEPQQVEVMIGFTDDAFEIIEQKLVERRTINVGLL